MATSQDWQCNKSLGECLGHLLETTTCTDVTFLVGGAKEVVHAHKLILISRSPVFYAMFEGPLSEKGEVAIPDIDKDTFVQFLRYLYTDDVKLTCDNVTYLLYAAKKYCVDLLAQRCNEFITASLNPENACTLLEHAHLCSEDQLATECRKFIFQKPEMCLTSSGFTDLCSTCVLGITDSDDLMTSEDKVYRAVMKWSVAQCGRQKLDVTDTNKRKVLGDIIYTVRFPCMSQHSFIQEVLCGDILSHQEMIEIQRTIYKLEQKDELMFKSSPRKSLHDVKRAIRNRCSTDSGDKWNQQGKCDALCFRISKTLRFHGIGVYGAKDGHGQYDIELRLYDQNDTILGHVTRKIHTDQSADIFEIEMDNPIQLQPFKVYTVAIEMTGPEGKHGVCGIGKISVDGVDITFTKSNKCTNGTDVIYGQIPCILVSMIR